MATHYSFKHALGHLDRTMRLSMQDEADRQADEEFWQREAKRAPDHPRDPCKRCGVTGLDHEQAGCRKYVPATPAFTPRASFHHNHNGGV